MAFPKRIMIAWAGLLLLPLLTGCALDPVERLTEEIKSQELEVRRQAVRELANLQDERTLELLTDVLEGDDELYDMAGVALVKKGREFKDPDVKKPNPVVDAVGKVVANAHLTENFRGRAAWVLGEIGDRRAIAPLKAGQAAILGEKPALLVREMSNQALEKIGYFSDGRAFDIGLGSLEGELSVLPDPPPLPG